MVMINHYSFPEVICMTCQLTEDKVLLQTAENSAASPSTKSKLKNILLGTILLLIPENIKYKRVI